MYTFFIREQWVQGDGIDIFGLFSEKYLDCCILNVYPNVKIQIKDMD